MTHQGRHPSPEDRAAGWLCCGIHAAQPYQALGAWALPGVYCYNAACSPLRWTHPEWCCTSKIDGTSQAFIFAVLLNFLFWMHWRHASLSDPKLLKPLESLSLVYWFLDAILAVYGKFEGSLPSWCRLAWVHQQSFSIPSGKLLPPASVKPHWWCVLQVLPLPFGISDVFHSKEGLHLAPAAFWWAESLECEI